MNKIKPNEIKCAKCQNLISLPCDQNDEDLDLEGLKYCNKCIEPSNIVKIIECQIANTNLNLQQTSTKDSCEKLETLIKQIEQFLKDPDYFIHEEINELQRQLQFKRDKLKKQIDDEFEKAFKQLEDYKESSSDETNNYKTEKITAEVKHVRNKLTEWVEFINEMSSNESKLIEIETESDKSIDHLEHEMDILKQKMSIFQVSLLKNINIDSAFDYLRFHLLIIDLINDYKLFKSFLIITD